MADLPPSTLIWYTLADDLPLTALDARYASVIDGVAVSGTPVAGQAITALTSATANWQTPLALDTIAADITAIGAARLAGGLGKAADAGHVHTSPDPGPYINSLKAWTFDAGQADNSVGALPTAGNLYLTMFYNPSVQTLTTLWYYVATGGTG